MAQKLTVSTFPPPLVHRPRSTLPILLSVPHSGRDYAPELVGLSRMGRTSLATLEDPLVDRLVWRALKRGAGAVIAKAPRALIDCNRSESDLDPNVVSGAPRAPLSARVRGGLGLIPARTHRHGYLWKRPLSLSEVEERTAGVHRPFHDAIDAMISEIVDTFGCALLLDCHSMPPAPGLPALVIGDAHGRSASRWLSNMAVEVARREGFEATLNEPYAGGHVVERHGRPTRGVHALQIEVNRAAYLDSALTAPGPGFDAIARLLDTIAEALGSALVERKLAAAE